MNISEDAKTAFELREANRKLLLAELLYMAAEAKTKRWWVSRQTRERYEAERWARNTELASAQDYFGVLHAAYKAAQLREQAESHARFSATMKAFAQADKEIDRVKIRPEDLKHEAKCRGFKEVKSFCPGQRCCRFWNPRSDNENGCYITEIGVMVFTPHDKPFMSWRDVFGIEFVKAYGIKEPAK